MKYSVYAIAESLRRHHGFDFDVAFLSAWYGVGHRDAPVATPFQVGVRMGSVCRCPSITDAQAEQMLAAYAARRKSPCHCLKEKINMATVHWDRGLEPPDDEEEELDDEFDPDIDRDDADWMRQAFPEMFGKREE